MDDSRFDPRKLKLVGGKPGGPGAGRVQAQEIEEQARRKRISDLLALRNMARTLEKQPLYFIPAEFNPLAVIGFLQPTCPTEGIDKAHAVPWSVPVAFIDEILPKVEVPNRKFTYYEVRFGGGQITMAMHDVVEEPPRGAAEKEPDAAPSKEEEEAPATPEAGGCGEGAPCEWPGEAPPADVNPKIE